MARPLTGCVVTLGGTFPGESHARISVRLRQLGATVGANVSGKTTHVITTNADFDTNAKVRLAQRNYDCLIVSLEWANESERNGLKADEATYRVDGSDPVDGADGNSENKSDGKAPKRAAASRADQPKNGGKRDGPIVKDEDDSDEPAPPAKKRRTANGKKQDDDEDLKGNGDVEPKDEPKDEPVVADGQIAKSRDAKIPLDLGVPMTDAGVYIDPSGIIYDASLNQTNAGKNNNKFYRIQLLHSGSDGYKVWTRWGRVGEFGQSALLGSGVLDNATTVFNKKFKDKSGHSWEDRLKPPKSGKYTFIERNYESDSEDDDDGVGEDEAESQKKVKSKGKAAGAGADETEEPKCTLDPAVASLMELIFNRDYFAAAMNALNYDAKKLPLGKLSKSTILRGYQALKDLAEVLNDSSIAQTKHNTSDVNGLVEQLSNQFYTYIPHDFGRHRPPIIHSDQLLKKEIELLESLMDMKEAADIMSDRQKTAKMEVHPLDSHFRGLGLEEMSVLDPQSVEFKQLSDYLHGSKGSTHGLNFRIDQIFRIERGGEFDRFKACSYPKTVASDKRLLWHGSRATNFGGILSQGLRIAPPEAPVSGYMFGKGIYLADMSSKSANYCNAYASHGHALLLLCEADLGSPMHQLQGASYSAGEDAKMKGSVSTWGQGITGPSQWKDAGCVHSSLQGVSMPDVSVKPGNTGIKNAVLQYNEYITYDVAQIRLRYLFRLKM